MNCLGHELSATSTLCDTSPPRSLISGTQSLPDMRRSPGHGPSPLMSLFSQQSHRHTHLWPSGTHPRPTVLSLLAQSRSVSQTRQGMPICNSPARKCLVSPRSHLTPLTTTPSDAHLQDNRAWAPSSASDTSHPSLYERTALDSNHGVLRRRRACQPDEDRVSTTLLIISQDASSHSPSRGAQTSSHVGRQEVVAAAWSRDRSYCDCPFSKVGIRHISRDLGSA
ncbi:hypothetical protein CALVIDRAFT_355179 [Calocera viscosa TUFC12733]|uniref:Uncharacterized protein n=1 Tax=Calocera viscosa (strain TUFC12733) TaxID=1330018 RepID=A0A167QDA3_CALVF|nr:hypothetical protein CALVIDRAFT_355179 [Calocera viscosa TUFC12733]